MIRLEKSLNAWGRPDFIETLRHEIIYMNAELLPLQQGLSIGNYVISGALEVMMIDAFESESGLFIKVGIFFKSVISGCSCADDPTPANEYEEYCMVEVSIDKFSAAATISLAID